MKCFFARFDDRKRPCEGRTDPCHLISKQALKKELDGRALLWDLRFLVEGCRLHHGEFDAYKLSVPRESLPRDLVSLCDELGLTHLLDRRYGSLQRL